MATKIFCDICNKELPEKFKEKCLWEVKYHYKMYQINNLTDEYHICINCHNELELIIDRMKTNKKFSSSIDKLNHEKSIQQSIKKLRKLK